MKPTGRNDFGFDSALVTCLRDDIENCELEASFKESLGLQLVAKTSTIFIVSSQPDTKRAFQDLLNLLIVFLIRVLLKPNFLKQHKTDLEQYPLAPISTAKKLEHQPVDSMIL